MNNPRLPDKFCILPWIHMHVWPDGRAFPCCLATMDSVLGSTKHHSVEQLWNSDTMRQARQQMLKGDAVSWCSNCYTQEKSGAESLRITKNRDFAHLLDRRKLTNDNGSLDEIYMGYMDIRFSNLCNMKCRMCGPHLSSQWYRDSVALGMTSEDSPLVTDIKNNSIDDFNHLINTWLPTVEEIYWAGGEPLIIDEHYQILEQLIQSGRTDVRLLYNTNFSKLGYRGKNVIDLWEKFSFVNIGASLDAEHHRAEYMRHGTNWNLIIKNRIEMQQRIPHHDFWISSTVTALNASHIIDFFESWVSQGLVEPTHLDINVVFNPNCMQPQILPIDIKRRIQDRVADFLNKYHIDANTRTAKALTGFANRLNEDLSHFQHEFYNHMIKLDKLRNESLFTVFPELDFLKKFE